MFTDLFYFVATKKGQRKKIVSAHVINSTNSTHTAWTLLNPWFYPVLYTFHCLICSGLLLLSECLKLFFIRTVLLK